MHVTVGAGCRLKLNDSDADGKEEEGEPFDGRELLAEKHDGKGGGREDLHLVRHLERRRVQVARCHELEIILDYCSNDGVNVRLLTSDKHCGRTVEYGRDGELPAVCTEDFLAQLPAPCEEDAGVEVRTCDSALLERVLRRQLYARERNRQRYCAKEDI